MKLSDSRTTTSRAGRGASILAASAAMLTVGPLLAQQASFVPLGDVGGGAFYSEANNLSADGRTVVGFGSDSAGLQPIVWQDGALSVLDRPQGYSQGFAAAVSGDGAVIVGVVGAFPATRGVIWRPGSMSIVSPVPTHSVGSALTDVSFDGSVCVGWSTNGAALCATRYSGGANSALAVSSDSAPAGVSSDGLVAVGRWVSPGYQYEACRWIENGPTIGMADLPGGLALSYASDANADGSVVVGVVNTAASAASNEGEAARWENNAWVSLGDFSGGLFNSYATGVTDDGAIVVGRGTTAAGQEAFVWDSTNGMRSLGSILSGQFGVDLSGWRLTLARKISGDGTHVVGRGINPAGNTEAFVAHVPCFVPPRILEQPSPTAVCAGSDAILAVLAGGDGTGQLTYSWRRNGLPISDGETPNGSVITGASSAILSIANPTKHDAGAYVCIFSNRCGEVTSMSADLTVCACLACPADFNLDGGIDGSDVGDFFAAWEAGSCDADVNDDGGVDGTDVEVFFPAWEAGGCG